MTSKQIQQQLGWQGDSSQKYSKVENPKLSAFLTESLRYRWGNQAKLELQLEEKLQRIQAWVLDDTLDESRHQQAKTDVDANEYCRTYYENLQETVRQIDLANAPHPLTKIRQQLQQVFRSEPSSPKIPSILAFRGQGGQAQSLDVPSMFSFSMRLVFGGLSQQKRFVRGHVYNIEETGKLEEIQGATIWLLPEQRGNWHKGVVEADGKFNLPDVPPGKYQLEMAWGEGQFLEVLDIVIPAG
jgi:hypothetical protein